MQLKAASHKYIKIVEIIHILFHIVHLLPDAFPLQYQNIQHHQRKLSYQLIKLNYLVNSWLVFRLPISVAKMIKPTDANTISEYNIIPHTI